MIFISEQIIAVIFCAVLGACLCLLF